MSKEHDHDHSRAHSHSHEHGHGCCGHDHSHDHDHDHDHAHKHDHEHKHEHKHECCGHNHDHAHDHGHTHKHECSNPSHSHSQAHGCCAHDHAHSTNDAEWTRRFFGFLQGLVLLMIGGVMVYFVVSGRIDGRNPNAPYVTGWFKGLALAGGLGLMVMGLFNWITSRREVDCGHDHDHDHTHASEDEEEGSAPHIHSHDGSATGRALTLLVLSGSIAAAAIYTPDGFSGKYAINKGFAYSGDANSAAKFAQTNPELAAVSTAPGGFTLAKVEEYIKRTPAGDFPLSVINLHYMGADAEYAAVMDGQPVETTGQVVKDELNPGPKNLRIFTMQVTCCAADARPYSVPIVFDGNLPDYVEMGWYKAKGKLEFIQERGLKIARLRIAKPEDLQATIRPDPERQSY